MSNIPTSLSEICLTLSRLTMRMGGKIRGFKIGKRLIRASSSWIFRNHISSGYGRLIQPQETACSRRSKPMAKLINWGRRFTSGARSLCSSKPGSGYVPVDQEPMVCKKPVSVPKGHLAVYVGQKDGEFHRVLVPVMYFNHPLFGELLKEAEEEYGFNQQGGITIPCGYSEFERVHTRIQSSGGGAGRCKLTLKRNHC